MHQANSLFSLQSLENETSLSLEKINSDTFIVPYKYAGCVALGAELSVGKVLKYPWVLQSHRSSL